jgi:hypothetical protein
MRSLEVVVILEGRSRGSIFREVSRSVLGEVSRARTMNKRRGNEAEESVLETCKNCFVASSIFMNTIKLTLQNISMALTYPFLGSSSDCDKMFHETSRNPVSRREGVHGSQEHNVAQSASVQRLYCILSVSVQAADAVAEVKGCHLLFHLHQAAVVPLETISLKE